MIPAIICDLDGTLALLHGRNPYDASTCRNDKLNVPIASIANGYSNVGYELLLVSGRSDLYRLETEQWLADYGIKYTTLFMRPDGDNIPDDELKQRIYDEHIKYKYDVFFVLDDRSKVVAMWRRNKLTCLQVAYGDF